MQLHQQTKSTYSVKALIFKTNNTIVMSFEILIVLNLFYIVIGSNNNLKPCRHDGAIIEGKESLT